MGMLTTVGSVEFQEPTKIVVDSTFEKDRKAAALAAMDVDNEEVLDKKTLADFAPNANKLEATKKAWKQLAKDAAEKKIVKQMVVSDAKGLNVSIDM
jgi:hypothetical protein